MYLRSSYNRNCFLEPPKRLNIMSIFSNRTLKLCLEQVFVSLESTDSTASFCKKNTRTHNLQLLGHNLYPRPLSQRPVVCEIEINWSIIICAWLLCSRFPSADWMNIPYQVCLELQWNGSSEVSKISVSYEPRTVTVTALFRRRPLSSIMSLGLTIPGRYRTRVRTRPPSVRFCGGFGRFCLVLFGPFDTAPSWSAQSLTPRYYLIDGRPSEGLHRNKQFKHNLFFGRLRLTDHTAVSLGLVTDLALTLSSHFVLLFRGLIET